MGPEGAGGGAGRLRDDGAMDRRGPILHVDLDAFFAAVEQRDRPELRGKPVIVGGGGPNQRGVVSAASYEARAFGVHSAMPLRTAGRLCPQGVFLPVDGTKYQAVSRDVMAILRRFTPLVEPISIDEAFLDVTGSRALFGDGETIGRRIREDVRAELDLTISVGVATTKLVAKIASDLRKPDALVVVPPGEERPSSRRCRSPGCGASVPSWPRHCASTAFARSATSRRCPTTCSPGASASTAPRLETRARGVDADPVGGRDAAKSVSHEHTFDVDTSDREIIERTILAMAEGVAGRLRDSGVKAATVTVKIRDSSFRTITRQRTLPEPTDLTEPIFRTALELARPEVRGLRIRLLGVAASGLGEREQLSLFAADDPRRRRVVEAADEVRHRFGERAITRARLVGSRLPAPFERDPMTAAEARPPGSQPRMTRSSKEGPVGKSSDDSADDGIDDIDPTDD